MRKLTLFIYYINQNFIYLYCISSFDRSIFLRYLINNCCVDSSSNLFLLKRYLTTFIFAFNLSFKIKMWKLFIRNLLKVNKKDILFKQMKLNDFLQY